MVKRILVITGGGSRGVIPAQFLKRLEENLETSLFDTFDMYSGTSSGALIVSAIAYEKLTGKYVSDELFSVKNIKQIFHKSWIDKIFGTFQLYPKYNNIGLQNLIDSTIKPSTRLCDSQKDIMITSFDVEQNKPVFFKSFKEKRNLILKDILVSSCSAPGIFNVFHNIESNLFCIDGGVHSNDPTDDIYCEALLRYGKNEDIRILSIGTGYSKDNLKGSEVQNYGMIPWVLKGNLIDIIFNAPQKCVVYRTNVFTKALGHKYIHVNMEIDNVTMDETSEINIIKLKEIGDTLWNKFGSSVLDLLK